MTLKSIKFCKVHGNTSFRGERHKGRPNVAWRCCLCRQEYSRKRRTLLGKTKIYVRKPTFYYFVQCIADMVLTGDRESDSKRLAGLRDMARELLGQHAAKQKRLEERHEQRLIDKKGENDDQSENENV